MIIRNIARSKTSESHRESFLEKTERFPDASPCIYFVFIFIYLFM